MIRLANRIYSEPARFFCMFENRHKGKWRYADFNYDCNGDNTVSPHQ